MRYLLDTHLLLWIAEDSDRLPAKVSALVDDPDEVLMFSAASLWEIAIKARLGRADFRVDAGLLRRGLLEHGFDELSVTGVHAARVQSLPLIHRDPFDRMLVVQAIAEDLVLLTSDAAIKRYPGPIEAV